VLFFSLLSANSAMGGTSTSGVVLRAGSEYALHRNFADERVNEKTFFWQRSGILFF